MASDPVTEVRRRLTARLHDEYCHATVADPADDGSWADVDYGDRSVTTWAPDTHLMRSRSLAASGRIEAATRALEAWLARDPKSENWWHNRVGAPLKLGDSAVLLYPYLEASLRGRIAAVLSRARWDEQTGQNLLWAAQVKVRQAVVAGDAALLAEAFERAQTVLRVTVEEGIQPDYSFHQHGAQLYSGGYGHEFACDAVRLATLASGTKFAFGPEAIEVLTRYVLDGLRWMIHAGQYDVTCLGRENSRPGAAHKARLLAPFVRDLARVTSERGDELMALADRLDGCDGAIPVAGARYFWRSDYLAVHRAGWSASVKLSSTRTVLPESGNVEGLRNRHLADGVCLLQRGAVASIAPVWNWRMLPGLTAVHHTGGFPTSTFGLDDSGEWVTGGSQFAGGVSDGESAIAAMHLRHDGVRAQKAWFFFPGGYAALGTGIVSLVDHPVRTTVEQTRFAGEYAVPAGTARAGRSTHERLAWLEHDNVRYVFPETSTVQVEAGPITGSWSAISGCQSGTPIHDSLIVVWLDHGVRPDGASYCYFVLPERGGATPVILANDLALQAIWHQDTVHAVFHEPGVLDLPDGRSIDVDKPLLVLLAHGRLHAANPLGAEDVVTIGVGADRIRLTVSGETTTWPEVAR